MKKPSYFSILVLVFIINVNLLYGQHDKIIDRATLSTCTTQFIKDFEFAETKTQGLNVSNPTNNDIGYKIAADHFVFADDVFWYPVNGKKVILNGLLQDFFIHDDNHWYTIDGPEHDWNLRIVPDPDFAYILKDLPPHAYFDINDEDVTTKFCVVNGQTLECLYAEVTPDESLYKNDWFPNFTTGQSPLKGRKVCVYGAWVRDSDHGYWPEIHPLECIWWRTTTGSKDVFVIVCVQDDSNRFDTKTDFMNNGPATSGHQPWSKAPITTDIKIPFEYDYEHTDHLIINIEEIKAHNVVTSTLTNLTDSDDEKNHILKYNKTTKEQMNANSPDNIIVEVNENISNGSNLVVQFVDIAKKANGHIVGYVKITTAYGKNSDGDEGYHLLNITKNNPIKKIGGLQLNPHL